MCDCEMRNVNKLCMACQAGEDLQPVHTASLRWPSCWLAGWQVLWLHTQHNAAKAVTRS
jgi:hypothetical protein